jgi:hypothetical protein
MMSEYFAHHIHSTPNASRGQPLAVRGQTCSCLRVGACRLARSRMGKSPRHSALGEGGWMPIEVSTGTGRTVQRSWAPPRPGRGAYVDEFTGLKEMQQHNDTNCDAHDRMIAGLRWPGQLAQRLVSLGS